MIFFQDMGVPMFVKTSIQINLVVRKTKMQQYSVRQFNNKVVPIFWLQVVSISFTIKKNLYNNKKFSEIQFFLSHILFNEFQTIYCKRIIVIKRHGTPKRGIEIHLGSCKTAL